MKSPAPSIFVRTIVSIEEVRLFLSEEGVPSISIKLHSSEGVVSLVQNVVLKLSNDEDVILEGGIVTLLIKAGLPFPLYLMETKGKPVLNIPLGKDIRIMDSTKATLYTKTKGRIVSVEFDL